MGRAPSSPAGTNRVKMHMQVIGSYESQRCSRPGGHQSSYGWEGARKQRGVDRGSPFRRSNTGNRPKGQRQASIPEGVWKEQFSKWEPFVQSPNSNTPDTLQEQGRETKPVRVVVAEVRAEGRSVRHLSDEAVGVPDFDAHSCPPGKKLYRALICQVYFQLYFKFLTYINLIYFSKEP